MVVPLPSLNGFKTMRDRDGDICFVNISFFQNVGFTSPNEDVFVREGIAALPPEVKFWTHVETLKLAGNRLTGLPEAVGWLLSWI